MEAEEAGSTGLVMLVSWPCIGCRTSLPSVVKSNVAFLDTGGSSRLAVHTIVFSATPARKIPTAYPLPCWWNPKAYRPEGDSQDKFEPVRKDVAAWSTKFALTVRKLPFASALKSRQFDNEVYEINSFQLVRWWTKLGILSAFESTEILP
ncbi:hypothetical protein RJ640_020555 [Escallonia rubra]|uniref:Uncharacterized protein n=1 Tax=Escallonia rubra TaxID=112253 RepID=A0AA88U3N0_9ASTE|nr:hypothetical protein RJ640_020555 [Escallonia rubra]